MSNAFPVKTDLIVKAQAEHFIYCYYLEPEELKTHLFINCEHVGTWRVVAFFTQKFTPFLFLNIVAKNK